MSPLRWILLAALLASPLHALAQAPAPTDADVVARAVAWLATEEAVLSTPSPGQRAIVEAVAQAGLDVRAWPPGGTPLWDRLRSQPATLDDPWAPYKSEVRLLHAIAVSGHDPRTFVLDGKDLVRRVWDGHVAGQFGDPTTVNDDMYALLALRAAGEGDDPRLAPVAASVAAAQGDDGGWSYAGGRAAPSDTDMTGMALAALAAAGRDVRGDARALAFLASTRDPTTGAHATRAPSAGSAITPNCQATAWALHAYHVLGEAPHPGAKTWLRGLQRQDGAFYLGSRANAFCTAEALIVFTPTPHLPFPGFAPAAVVVQGAEATLPTRLRVSGPFTAAHWRLPDADVVGNPAEVTFETPGERRYQVAAVGPTARRHLEGTFAIRSPAPTAAVATASVETLRGVPVTLDATPSTDRDGRVVAMSVHWGEGEREEHATLVATHAYAAPGTYDARVRVKDDAGAWSPETGMRVLVRNRAPLLEAPARLDADRTRDVVASVQATDPEGDAVTLAWSPSPPPWRFDRLGEHAVRVTATDAFGAEVSREVRVHVANLAPDLVRLDLPQDAREGVPFHVRAEVRDADGPPPALTWSTPAGERAGPTIELTLPAGAHELRLVAVDADGARRTWTRAIVVAGPDEVAPPPSPPAEAPPTPAPPPPPFLPREPPRVLLPERPRAGEEARLDVAGAEGATLFRVAFGDGTTAPWAPTRTFVHAWQAPGAYEVRVDARDDEGERASVVGLVEVGAPPQARPDQPTLAAPAAPPTRPPEPTLLTREEGRPVSAASQEAPQETPGLPSLLVLAALLLASAPGTRARRGRR